LHREDVVLGFPLNDSQKIDIFNLLDKANITSKKKIIRFSNFLDPYLVSIAKRVLEPYHDINYKALGGYEGAERQIIILYPDYFNKDQIDIPLRVLNIKDLPNGITLNHREILGSILGLGLKRDKVGDIIINENITQIIVLEEIADFLDLNLSRIGKYRVKTSITDIDNVLPKKDNFKMIKANIKSLRLDSICAAGFNESRTKSASNIKSGKVKVNYMPIDSVSYMVNEGDLISYMGKGRIFFQEILGKTKKDRYNVLIKKSI
jgi:RNA-binding protein YlmH